MKHNQILRSLTCFTLVLLSSTSVPALTITPAEFVTISHGEKISIVCQTQPPQALADCGFQIAPPTFNGPLCVNASAAVADYWNLTVTYDAESLTVGQCRLHLKASPLYKEENFPVGCRVRTERGGWQYGYTSIVDSSWLPKEISLSTDPKEAFLLPGSSLTVHCDSANDFPLEKCSFKLPGREMFDLSRSTSVDGFQYVGAGLENFQCGIFIPDISTVVSDEDDAIECATYITYRKIPTREVRVNTARCLADPPTLDILSNKDKVVEIRCTAPSCRPPAAILWYLDGTPVPSDNVTEVPVDKWRWRRDLEATTQVLRLDLAPELLGKTVECVVVHLASNATGAIQIPAPAESSWLAWTVAGVVVGALVVIAIVIAVTQRWCCRKDSALPFIATRGD